MSTKNKPGTSTLTPWRESVLTMVKEKIKKLKQKVQLRQRNQYYVILMLNDIGKHSTNVLLL